MIIIQVLIILLLFSISFLCGSDGNFDTRTDITIMESVEEGQEPDYEFARQHKKTFGDNDNYIGVSSEVELYNERQEPEDEKIEVKVTAKRTDYPYMWLARYDVEVTAQANAFSFTVTKDQQPYSAERSIKVEGRHIRSEFNLEFGNAGWYVIYDSHNLEQHCEETEDGQEDDQDIEPDEEKPVYENEHHFERDLRAFNDTDGIYTTDTSVEIYKEPQEPNDSDGLEIVISVDWDEPLYYLGSEKHVGVNYNGYGIEIIKNGPDAGMNGDSSIEITTKHVNAGINTELDTGMHPN